MIECVEVKFYTVYGWVMHMYFDDGTTLEYYHEPGRDRWFRLFGTDTI